MVIKKGFPYISIFQESEEGGGGVGAYSWKALVWHNYMGRAIVGGGHL